MSQDNYYSLTKEQKLSNLLLTKKSIEEKIQNLQKQLEGINKKLLKYQTNQGN